MHSRRVETSKKKNQINEAWSRGRVLGLNAIETDSISIRNPVPLEVQIMRFSGTVRFPTMKDQ